MRKSLVYFLTCAIFLPAFSAPAEVPFWKAKEKVYSRIKNGEIVVAVHSAEGEPPKPHILIANGGGQSDVPREFLFELAQKYDQLPRASDYIKATSYDAAKKQVTMDTAAYGYKAHFTVEVHPVKNVEPWRLDYKILDGPLEGMVGSVSFAELGAKKMEIGLTGEARYSELKIPRFFLEFGLEVILQKMAARLRGFAAAEYAKTRVESH